MKPEACGQDLGRRLAEDLVAYARKANYAEMLLDTLGSMTTAKKLYMSLGFKPAPPYYDNPLPGTLYLALEL